MDEKIIIEMGGQIISIEFHFSFLTIYNNIVCTDGKVPAKIILLYGGISSYTLFFERGGSKSCRTFDWLRGSQMHEI